MVAVSFEACNDTRIHDMSTLLKLRSILRDTLLLGERADALNADSLLLGALPELDSMAVVHILTAIEDEFGVTMEGGEINASIFATLGSLANFIDRKQTA